jgi:hypothetical protein
VSSLSGARGAQAWILSRMNNQPTLALDRVLRVLQPLVRMLVKNGVTYPVLAAALKRVFLGAAQQELAARGMAATDSAVSLLSGVHRRDVRTLTRGATMQAADTDAPALGLAAQVVARWMNDPAYAAADGTRRVLPRSGPAPSFDALVAGVSSDVRGRAVLDELLRLGVVSETDAGLTLDRSGFAPRGNFAEASWLSAQNLHDHAAAMVANLHGEGSFLDQAVFVDEITADSAQHLRRVSVAAWKAAFKTVMEQAQQLFDADAAGAPREQRQHRARFGVYFFSDREESE